MKKTPCKISGQKLILTKMCDGDEDDDNYAKMVAESSLEMVRKRVGANKPMRRWNCLKRNK